MSLPAMNRRSFLATATTVTAATLLTSRLGWAAGDHKIEKVGLQLYTVRDLGPEEAARRQADLAASYQRAIVCALVERSHAAAQAPHPFFAIGGIDASNASQVIEAGAHRLCIVRAIRDAVDPAAAAEELRRAFAPLGEEAPGG